MGSPVSIPATSSYLLLPLFLLSVSESAFATGARGGNMSTAPFASGAKGDKSGSPILMNSAAGKQQMVEDPQYQNCGQNCLYGKANENLSMQVLYVENKLSFLARTNVSPQEQRDVLGNFCQHDDKNVMTESLDGCRERYIRVSELWLAKVRTALRKNDESEMEVSCPKRDRSGKCLSREGTAFLKGTAQRDSSKSKQQTYISRSDELPKFAPRRNPAAIGKDWINYQYNQLAPTKEDFVKFKRIPRDPSNPALGTFVVAEKDANGKTVYDDKAYQAALALFQGVKANKIIEVSAHSRDRSAKLKSIQTLHQEQDAKMQSEFKKGVARDQRSATRRLYDDTRAQYIDAVNNGGSASQNVFSPGAQTMSFPGSGRSTGDETVKPGVADRTTFDADEIRFRTYEMNSDSVKQQMLQGSSGNPLRKKVPGGP